MALSEDNEIYTVCGRCLVKISGPTSEAVNIAFRGHEKEAHGYMTGQEFYDRFSKGLNNYDTELAPLAPEQMLCILECAKIAAGLESSHD